MNNASSPTSPADPLQASDHHSPSLEPPDTDPRHDAGRSGSTAQSPSLSAKAKEGLSKKWHFLTSLAHNLDTLVYAELCVLYYMDCSFFRLFLRWIAQALFISPKPEETLLIVPNYHVSAIAGPNLFCMFLHLVSSLPEAGEATRGYLHGGILIDFIGQKAPTSKFYLVLLDILLLGLQCFMMTVNMERERIRKVIKSRRRAALATVVAGLADLAPTGQDHDAEERGVLRDAPVMDEPEDIELRPLQRGNSEHERDQREVEEGTGLLASTSSRRNGEFEALTDVLRSGNAVLATFDVRRALQTAWHDREGTPENAAAFAIQNVGYNATRAAMAAQRRARLAAARQRQP
ncbi:DUF1746-domain-containing protein [Xylariomycetidae sp. FL0641]|nr:DUF1746-domain-containing protein [Xylariomycetidae sp. FL0641]